MHGPKEKKTLGPNLTAGVKFAQCTGAGLNRCPRILPIFCRVRLTAYLAGALSRICQCIRSCFGAWTHGLPSLPALRAWPAPSWANASSTGLRGTGEPRRCGAGCGAGAYRDHRSISNGTSQARSAGRDAEALRQRCKTASEAVPTAAERFWEERGQTQPAEDRQFTLAPVQASPRTLGEFDPCGQIRPQRLFFLLDRARPAKVSREAARGPSGGFSLFGATEKRKWGVHCPAITMAEFSPARQGEYHSRSWERPSR